MNNLDYLNSISGQDELTDMNPEKPKKSGMKYALFAISGIIVLVAISIFVVMLVVRTEDKLTDDSEEDYSLQDDTGGEEVELAENEKTDFLTKYGLSADDVADVDWKVIKYLDEYYVDTGFNSVKYDLDSVTMTSEKDLLSFTFASDVSDVKFKATLLLDPSDGSMKDISFSPITTD